MIFAFLHVRENALEIFNIYIFLIYSLKFVQDFSTARFSRLSSFMMLENQSSIMLIARTARRTTQGENLLNRDGIMSSLIQCIHESTVT